MLSTTIRDLRLRRGISQVDLASSLCVSKQAVSNWENNNIQPSIDMLVRIADYFDVSTDFLLGREATETISTRGLTPLQTAHIKLLINDLEQSSHPIQ